jgi:hypothetical protein
MRRFFSFIGRVLKAAFRRIVGFVKDVVTNAPGICLLAGAAVGFTTLATQLPFQLAMPLWVESLMVAPIIGVMTVFILVMMMRIQLAIQR